MLTGDDAVEMFDDVVLIVDDASDLDVCQLIEHRSAIIACKTPRP